MGMVRFKSSLFRTEHEHIKTTAEKPQKVWAVSIGEVQASTHIQKIFSTEEKAKAFVSVQKKTEAHRFSVFDVDEIEVE